MAVDTPALPRQANRPEARDPRFFYGYVVVAAAMLIDLVMAGTHFTFGIFFKPVSTEFHWSRAATSGAFTLYSILHGALFIVTGRISDRFGPKPMMIASGIFFGLGLALMSTITSIWQMYVYYGVFISIAMSGGFVPLMSTVARWFVKRRGLMTGLVLAGGGMGQALFPPVTTWLIAAVQWRAAYLIVAALVLVVVVALAFSLRRDPSQVGQLPYGAESAGAPGARDAEASMTLRQAMSTGRFWQYCLAVIVAQLGIGAMIVHAVPHGIDLGMSPSAAAGVVTTFAGVGVAARVVFGGVVDRAGGKRVMASMCLILAASLLGIGLTRSVVALFVFAPFFGIGFGGFVSSMSPLTAQFFGLRSHGAIFGVVTFAATIGGGVGPLLAGAVFDAQKSYGLAFIIMGVLAAVAFLGILFLSPSRSPMPAASR